MKMTGMLLAVLMQAALAPSQSGSVTGVLRNADGKPVAGVRVSVMAQTNSPGDSAASVLISIAETDEAGRYKLERIPPGRYRVVAGRLDAPTYYPGTLDASSAGEVSVVSGTNISGLDFVVSEGSARRPGGPQQLFPVPGGGLSNLPPDVLSRSELVLPLSVAVEGSKNDEVSQLGQNIVLRIARIGSVSRAVRMASTSIVLAPEPNEYRVAVESIPAGYALKSLTYGAIDLTKDTMNITPEEFGNAPPAFSIPNRPFGAAGRVLQSSLSIVLTPLPTVSPDGTR